MTDEKPCRVRSDEPRYIRVVQVLGALGTLAVVIAMYLQLAAIWHEQAVTLRPYVNLGGEASFRNLGRDDEMWDLTYILQNSGSSPAQEVFYRVEHTVSGELGTPTVYDNAAAITIAPSGGTYSFTKPFPRSEALDIQKKSERLYRHLYVTYKDARGRSYYSRASWILAPYEIGQPVSWIPLSSEGK